MASITSTGIGSGLDVGGLVQQLVAAEGQPTQIRIAQQEARAQAKISALGSLKSTLSAFNEQLEKMNELEGFQIYQATSSDDSLITVSGDNNSQPGIYDVEVQQLAAVQKLESGAFASSTDVVGTGTLTVKVGTDSFSVSIDASNNTLDGIRDEINNALDNKGVSATIVNTDDGSYLTLTGQKTGTDQTMTVTQTGGDGGLSALEYDPGNGLNSLTETQEALDALVEVNGRLVTNGENSITGVIEGVTINLVSAEVGVITKVTVENDTAAVKAQVDEFINTYNKLVETFATLTKYDPETRTGGALVGDSTIRGVRDQLRREMTTAVSDIDANFKSLFDIGIETDLEGKLSLDSAKFDAVVGPEFAKLGQLFANDDGYAVRLASIADDFLNDENGILTVRLDGLDKTVEDFADQRERLDTRLIALETRLLRQFNALDALVGELTSTSNFLTQQLQSLPKVSANNR